LTARERIRWVRAQVKHGFELRRLLRVERRLQVGRDRGEALGAEGIAAVGERAKRAVDPTRRPERLAGPGEGDRGAQRRLVFAPVEEALDHRGGAFEGEGSVRPNARRASARGKLRP